MSQDQWLKWPEEVFRAEANYRKENESLDQNDNTVHKKWRQTWNELKYFKILKLHFVWI